MSVTPVGSAGQRPARAELATFQRKSVRRLRIALLAPPWIAVPPPAYGGIESVVAMLAEELVARGHDVTLFAPPGSRSTARVRSPLQAAHPDRIGASLFEADHVAQAFEAIDHAAAGDGAGPFDLLHDHSGCTAVAMAGRLPLPVVHTLHAPLDAETTPFYERHGNKVRLVAISRHQLSHAPEGVSVGEYVPNPIRAREWPLQRRKGDYLLWMGRFDPVKGAHRAIAVARAAGMRLVLAGPVQPGQEQYFATSVQPHIDGIGVHYAGEVGGRRKANLFAHARAFLMPIRWDEPFGMVMVEALACGTPVIAFPEGAASEIVLDGTNGYLVESERAMAAALSQLDRIDPMRCRQSVAERYEAAIVAAGYEAVYARAIAPAQAFGAHLERQRALKPRRRTETALRGGALLRGPRLIAD